MRGLRLPVLIAASIAAALALSACSTEATPVPTETATLTPTASAIVTEAPTQAQVTTPTFTPWPTLPATPEPTIPPTPGPSTKPSVSAGPTSPAQFCTGTSKNQEFFVAVAHTMKTTVYCGAGMPSGWQISSGTLSGATLSVTYKYKNTTQKFVLQEGAFCTTDPVACVGGPHPAAGSGHTSFDGMTGEFLTTTGGFIIAVNPGTKNAYMITSTNVPQGTLVSISANMKAVPKT